METTLNNLTTGKDEGSTRVKRGVSEIITDVFEPFDHRGKIVTPFDSENKRDADFQEKLSLMLLELMLDFHAWSSARPLHESDKTADRLEKEINELIETEKDQDSSTVEGVYRSDQDGSCCSDCSHSLICLLLLPPVFRPSLSGTAVVLCIYACFLHSIVICVSHTTR
ncbi:hypothetical protein QCA50_020876 [Cerrena zonata]|uniref:Uncharacterized protein n=1 Tax=Cerrena zonata TaxID=2478898 RepID=A0AAW0FHS6_9APHY